MWRRGDAVAVPTKESDTSAALVGNGFGFLPARHDTADWRGRTVLRLGT